MQATVAKLVNMLFGGDRGGTPYASGPIAVLVNNLGGLSVLETQVLADQVMVRQRNPAVARFLVGTFVTSLDGPGFSVTLLALDDDNELLPLLDAPTVVSNWPNETFARECDMDVEGRLVTPQTEDVGWDKQLPCRLPGTYTVTYIPRYVPWVNLAD